MKETFYREEHYEDWGGPVGFVFSVYYFFQFIFSCAWYKIICICEKIARKIFKR